MSLRKILESISAKMKRDWVEATFSNTELQRNKDKSLTATVPLLYAVKMYVPTSRTHLTRKSTGRDRFILTPVEITAANTKEAYADLFDEIAMKAHKHDGLEMYRQKRGQSPEVIRVGEPMTVVRKNDPEHRHGSPRLVDTECIFIADNFRVTQGSLQTLHCHFLID